MLRAYYPASERCQDTQKNRTQYSSIKTFIHGTLHPREYMTLENIHAYVPPPISKSQLLETRSSARLSARGAPRPKHGAVVLKHGEIRFRADQNRALDVCWRAIQV
jgi:hypothetical protein